MGFALLLPVMGFALLNPSYDLRPVPEHDQADDDLATPLQAGDEVMIVAALSGG